MTPDPIVLAIEPEVLHGGIACVVGIAAPPPGCRWAIAWSSVEDPDQGWHVVARVAEGGDHLVLDSGVAQLLARWIAIAELTTDYGSGSSAGHPSA